MPVTYSRSPPTQPSYLADIFDVDESIVLSDLVRSGEVSRLRRRGAIAIRDSITPQSPGTSGIRRHSSAPFLHPPPRQEPDTSENDEDDAEYPQNGASRWFARFRPSFEEPPINRLDNTGGSRPFTPGGEGVLPQDGDGDSSSYVLFCGGRLRDGDWSNNPSNAPLTLDPPSRRRVFAFRPPPPTRRASHPRARRMNGCGVLVHLSAQPRRRQGTWVARGGAAESVARMDSRYFDCRVAARLTKSACGCVREGLGCRVCGNPLGIIYVPCQAAADGLSTPQTISSVLPLTGRTQTAQNGSTARPPFGPNYWLPTCQRRRNAATEEIYNFFSDSVRAAPEFTFPPRPSSEVPPSWSWSTRPPSPTTPVALASQHTPATSTPVPFAPPWWTYGLSDPLQAEGSHSDGDSTQQDDDGAEVDGAEKSEDSGPDHGGGASPFLWVEL
ncbi:hypothetical protein EDB89DRAFT_510240 [Lactarius sanguifluus]|nr:hypothetical protein EDB89DRAFT_510240 [Lactarius sanguifluus]